MLPGESCLAPAPCASEAKVACCGVIAPFLHHRAQQGVKVVRLHASGGVVSKTGPLRKQALVASKSLAAHGRDVS